MTAAKLFKSRILNSDGQSHLVYFSFYRDGVLYYKCHDGFTFPVPLSETTTDGGLSPVFSAEEKAITLMKWIRKATESSE